MLQLLLLIFFVQVQIVVKNLFYLDMQVIIPYEINRTNSCAEWEYRQGKTHQQQPATTITTTNNYNKKHNNNTTHNRSNSNKKPTQ